MLLARKVQPLLASQASSVQTLPSLHTLADPGAKPDGLDQHLRGFPWKTTEVEALLAWLHERNHDPRTRKVEFYGVDLFDRRGALVLALDALHALDPTDEPRQHGA